MAIALKSKSLQAVLPHWLSLQKKFAGSLDLMLIAGLGASTRNRLALAAGKALLPPLLKAG